MVESSSFVSCSGDVVRNDGDLATIGFAACCERGSEDLEFPVGVGVIEVALPGPAVSPAEQPLGYVIEE